MPTPEVPNLQSTVSILLNTVRYKRADSMKPSGVNLGGLLWKVPWKLSTTRKANARARLKKVDAVIEAVRSSGVQCTALDKALQLPKEHEMLPRDKYFMFSSTTPGYRKGIHKMPKWTRSTHRVNPKGF